MRRSAGALAAAVALAVAGAAALAARQGGDEVPLAAGSSDCTHVREGLDRREASFAEDREALRRKSANEPTAEVKLSIGLLQPKSLAEAEKIAGADGVTIEAFTTVYHPYTQGTSLTTTIGRFRGESFQEAVARWKTMMLTDLSHTLATGLSPEDAANVTAIKARVASGDIPVAGLTVKGPARALDELANKHKTDIYAVGLKNVPEPPLPLDPASRRITEECGE